MKLLELTDFYTKTKKEYVVVEQITCIQPHTEKFLNIKSDDRPVLHAAGFLGRLFGQKSHQTMETVEISREVVERNGSMVVLSNKNVTMVLESPEEIVALLASGTKTSQVKEA